MASVDFYKCKGGSHAKSILRHNDKDKRTVTKEHDNTQLDTSRTHLNTSVFGRSYEEVCRLYDERISELDATTNTNHRKDRVTMFDLNIPMPENLPPEKEDEWAGRVVEIIARKYGQKNVLEGYIHRDEKHEYIDARTHEKKESRTHLTVSVIAEVNGQLKGKEFSSRKNMMSLNREIEEISVQMYGVHFMTGKGKKGTDKVEDLKGLSRQAEADLLAEQKRLAREQEMLVREKENIDRRITEVARRENSVTLKERAQTEKAREYQAWEDALEAQKKAIEQREIDVSSRESAVTVRETRQNASETAFEEKVKAYNEKQQEDAKKRLKEGIKRREDEKALEQREKAVADGERELEERKRKFGDEVRKAAAQLYGYGQMQESAQHSHRRLPGE